MINRHWLVVAVFAVAVTGTYAFAVQSTFEVVSLKPTKEPAAYGICRGVDTRFPPARLMLTPPPPLGTCTYRDTLALLVHGAYVERMPRGVKDAVLGGPEWAHK